MIKKDLQPAKRERGGADREGPLSIFGITLFGRKPAPASKPAPKRPPPRRAANDPPARLHALQTTEKINQIESEMAQSLARVAAAALAPAGGSADAATVVADGNRAGAPTQPDPFLGVSTDAFLDNAAAIELTQPGAGPIVDSAAIAFASGDDADAAAQLRAGIDEQSLGDAEPNAWRMLLELHMLRDDRAGFEAEARRYAARFGRVAPAWRAYAPLVATAPPPAVPAVAAGAIRLPAALDAGLIEPLTALKAQAAQRSDLAIDFGAAQSIDGTGAELLLRVLAAFRGSAYRLHIAGIDRLLAVTQHAAVPGRRDVAEAIWTLRLDALRLAGRQTEYDDVAMQFCVTYEVSPPAWEPPPSNIELGPLPVAAAPAAAPAAAVPPAVEVLGDGRVAWRGHLDGAGDAAFAALLGQVPAHKALTVDCLDLRRLAYDTGSALLGHLMTLQARGATVVFVDVNPWVYALMGLLGIGAVAEVRARPA